MVAPHRERSTAGHSLTLHKPWGEAATDQEIVAAIQLLAQTEGIFTEPAGGTTVAVAKKLIEQGRIPRNESIVICITGNGYKTIEAVLGNVKQPYEINARLQDFDHLYQSLNQAAPSRAAAEGLH